MGKGHRWERPSLGPPGILASDERMSEGTQDLTPVVGAAVRTTLDLPGLSWKGARRPHSSLLDLLGNEAGGEGLGETFSLTRSA